MRRYDEGVLHSSLGRRSDNVMDLVHPQSCECAKGELDLFALPPTQTSIERGQWSEHRPMTTVTDGGPLEFVVSGSGEDYVDLSQTYLQITARILKPDGEPLSVPTEPASEPDTSVGPVNLWLHSVFSQVDLYMNDRLVTPSTNVYPYRAYLETLLSYGPAAKESHLTSALWYKDRSGFMDETKNNYGYMERSKFSSKSKDVSMMGRLHLDLFHQERLLLNGVDLKLRLIRSKPGFALMGEGRIEISDASLYVRKVKLNDRVQLAHIKALERGTAKYPVRRIEMKTFSVPKGNLTVNQENLFLGQLPKRLVLGCVDNDAFNGHPQKNPFNFKHYDANYVALYADGEQIPSKPLQPDFDNGTYVRSYASLYMALGQMGRDEGNHVTREDYARGYTLYAFDLTPDSDDGGGHFQLRKNGNLRLEVHFAEPLPTTINVVVYAEFDNIVEIDRARNVKFDYSA
jgi:hypothetical protein